MKAKTKYNSFVKKKKRTLKWTKQTEKLAFILYSYMHGSVGKFLPGFKEGLVPFCSTVFGTEVGSQQEEVLYLSRTVIIFHGCCTLTVSCRAQGERVQIGALCQESLVS